MAEEIKYKLYRDAGFGFYFVKSFDSVDKAQEYANNTRSRVEEIYKIVRVQTIETDLQQFTVPAYVPSLDEIAQEIIASSEGSFHVEWSDDFYNLSDKDRAAVGTMVWEEIDSCDGCGWHFLASNLNYLEGDNLCDNCISNLEEEDEEDED